MSLHNVSKYSTITSPIRSTETFVDLCSRKTSFYSRLYCVFSFRREGKYRDCFYLFNLTYMSICVEDKWMMLCGDSCSLAVSALRILIPIQLLNGSPTSLGPRLFALQTLSRILMAFLSVISILNFFKL